MSHFCATVCVKVADGEDPMQALDAALERYDERTDVTPWREDVTGDPGDFWKTDELREDGLLPDGPVTWEQVAAAYNAEYADDYPEGYLPLLIDDAGVYSMSTANPDGRFNYWEVGGRWKGRFVTADSTATSPWIPVRERWDDPAKPLERDQVNGGQRRHLNFDATRERAAELAALKFKQWTELTGHLPEAKPRSYFAAMAEDPALPDYTWNHARHDYRTQPRVQAVTGTDLGLHDDPISHFQRPEALFLERARAGAVPGFATITTDGRWMAPGWMSMWCSIETEPDRIGYWEAANAYLETLDADVYVFAVDCHR